VQKNLLFVESRRKNNDSQRQECKFTFNFLQMKYVFYDKCWCVIVDKYRIKNDLISTLFFLCIYYYLTVITNSLYSIMVRINLITFYYYHDPLNIDITRRSSTMCVRTNDAILESNNVINTCITCK